MANLFKFVIGIAALGTLAGCIELTTEATLSDGNAAAERACLNAVIKETGNQYASVGSSKKIAAGTEVIVAVGPQQAAWQCIAYPNGKTSRPTSLTNEGAL